MKQFLSDLPMRLKSDRKTQLIAVALIGCVLYLALAPSAPRRGGRPKSKPEAVASHNDPNERWTDLIERFNGQLNQLTTQGAALREDLDAQKKQMQEFEATTAEIFKKVIDRLSNMPENGGSQPASSGNPQSIGEVSAPDLIGAQADELESLGAPDVAAAPPVQPVRPKLAALMPGDSVRVKLLAGVNAPTDGTPYPVVLKLASDVMGPDGNSVPLGEARIIAAAQGSLTDSRVLFRLTRLSLRLPNGKRKEFPIDGWIVGEDGIRGMEGVLIDPIGKAIAGAGMAGGLAGLGQGIAAANVQNRVYSNGNTQSSVNANDVPAYAGGVALSSAATEWQQIIRDRLSQLVPVVQVLSGREATAVFSQSLAIPELLEQLDEEDSAVVFTSLD